MGGGHPAWPRIQQFDGIHRGRGLGDVLPWLGRPVSRGRVGEFVPVEGVVDCVMHLALGGLFSWPRYEIDFYGGSGKLFHAYSAGWPVCRGRVMIFVSMKGVAEG